MKILAQSTTFEIQVAQLDDQLEKTQITSPTTGTVLNRYAEVGELATMGTILFKIADISTLFRAYVTKRPAGGNKIERQRDGTSR